MTYVIISISRMYLFSSTVWLSLFGRSFFSPFLSHNAAASYPKFYVDIYYILGFWTFASSFIRTLYLQLNDGFICACCSDD